MSPAGAFSTNLPASLVEREQAKLASVFLVCRVTVHVQMMEG